MRVVLWMLTLSAFVWSNIGNVGALKGDADIIRKSRTLKVKSGMELEVKDKIVTSSAASVQVILKDNTVVTIGPDSSFVFDVYNFGTKETSQIAMHIDRGFFRSVTGKIGKLAPERFKVKTVSATIGIRGTDFSALVSKDHEIISCYRGKITALIDSVFHDIDAGIQLDNSNGKIMKKSLDKNIKVQFLDDSGNLKNIKADEMADAIQQEVQQQIQDETPLTQPTVEFPNR